MNNKLNEIKGEITKDEAVAAQSTPGEWDVLDLEVAAENEDKTGDIIAPHNFNDIHFVEQAKLKWPKYIKTYLELINTLETLQHRLDKHIRKGNTEIAKGYKTSIDAIRFTLEQGLKDE